MSLIERFLNYTTLSRLDNEKFIKVLAHKIKYRKKVSYLGLVFLFLIAICLI